MMHARTAAAGVPAAPLDAFTGLPLFDSSAKLTPPKQQQLGLGSSHIRRLLMGKIELSQADRSPSVAAQHSQRAAAATFARAPCMPTRAATALRAVVPKRVPLAAKQPKQKAARRVCSLCARQTNSAQQNSSSRYCRACESLRWSGRKEGIKLAALRLAIQCGSKNVLQRAAEFQREG